MNDELSTAINKYAIPVLAVAGALGGAALPGNLVNIASGLLTSVIGNKITSHDLINRLKHASPDKLNHDILKMSGEAVKFTVNRIVIDYKEKLPKNQLKEIEKEIGKIIDDTNSQIDGENWIKELNTKDVINYADGFNNYEINLTNLPLESVTAIDKLVTDNPFSTFFDERFRKYFKLYFGELLKEDKYRPAFIAYSREKQNMILAAVQQDNEKIQEKLSSHEFVSALKDEFQKYIEELSSQAVPQAILEEILKETQKQREKQDSYFKTNIISIQKSNRGLAIQKTNKVEGVVNNYHELKEYTNDVYYFKYNNDFYFIDELNEEAFDYLTGTIKYNQIFVKQIIEAIKDDCSEQYLKFYGNIEKKGSDWNTIDRLFNRGTEIISESFIGIMKKQLGNLFAIGKDTEESIEKNREKYIVKCNYIVKRTLDLVIFSFLSQLWDDVGNNKIKLKLPAEEDFNMNQNRKEQLALLCSLITVYNEHKPDSSMLLIPEVCEISGCFNENGKLYDCCTQLEKLTGNPNLLNCYYAEKQLTVFFEHFRFLVHYKLVSMKKIEYFKIKKRDDAAGYLHHYVNIGNEIESCGVEERKFDSSDKTVTSLFTNAVLLYRGEDYTCNINLFPFVIDYNALVLEKEPNIAFFFDSSEDGKLDYSYIDNNESVKLKHENIVRQKLKLGGSKHDVYLTDDDLKIYNKDCVIDTFHMIQESLFI
jgi:hypothetical protein